MKDAREVLSDYYYGDGGEDGTEGEAAPQQWVERKVGWVAVWCSKLAPNVGDMWRAFGEQT